MTVVLSFDLSAPMFYLLERTDAWKMKCFICSPIDCCPLSLLSTLISKRVREPQHFIKNLPQPQDNPGVEANFYAAILTAIMLYLAEFF
jgi:hypothetical protein